MKQNQFFITSKLFKELMILDIISKNAKTTQREMADKANVSVAMINEYIEKYSNDGSITLSYHSTKTVEYHITPIGEERRKYLYIQYLESSLDIYNNAKEECEHFLEDLYNKGFKNILFYGAGEVAEILLYVIRTSPKTNIKVLAIIDDNKEKQNTLLTNKNIISIDEINNYQYDGILISSYTNNTSIKEKLYNTNIDKDKVIEFFK